MSKYLTYQIYTDLELAISKLPILCQQCWQQLAMSNFAKYC